MTNSIILAHVVFVGFLCQSAREMKQTHTSTHARTKERNGHLVAVAVVVYVCVGRGASTHTNKQERAAERGR